ncbi:MAG: T9SS type A sorting domain-containing protein, partial [Prevotellaceae bacterium]|nr:T9SS type A sorting domain-containing protein [Prevotellaceae bacterium]
RSGYIFSGWYNDATFWSFGTATVTSNLTLTAQWEKDEDDDDDDDDDDDGETGVGDNALSGIALYPNPAGSYVILSGLEGGEVVDVINLSGTLLLSRKATGNKETIDLTSLPQGAYIVRVTKGSAARQLKLVVK